MKPFIKLTEVRITYEDDQRHIPQRCIQRSVFHIRPSFIQAIRDGGDITLLDLECGSTLMVEEAVEEVLARIYRAEPKLEPVS